MPAGKQILDRIKSVKNTGKITRAMELISTVKMKKAADIAIWARPFAIEASGIFSRVADEISMSPYVQSGDAPFLKGDVTKWQGDLINPQSSQSSDNSFTKDLNKSSVSSVDTSFKKEVDTKTLIVVVTSNRGLCGAYNINVFRETLKHIGDTSADFVTIGKKAREFVTRTGNNLIADYSDIFKDDPTAEQVKTISMSLRDLFLSEGYTEVKVIYSFYISAIAQKAVTRPFLPVSKDKLSSFLEEISGSFITPMTQTGEYKLEPSKKIIAEAIVPLILDLMFYEMLLEAKASEHAARMVAMKNARESSATKAKELTLIYNKARQAAITKEISEIVSGVESMKDI